MRTSCAMLARSLSQRACHNYSNASSALAFLFLQSRIIWYAWSTALSLWSSMIVSTLYCGSPNFAPKHLNFQVLRYALKLLICDALSRCPSAMEAGNLMYTFPLADLRGEPGKRTTPGVQILSFSCSFWQKNCKIISIWELAQPPRENPGSATVFCY